MDREARRAIPSGEQVGIGEGPEDPLARGVEVAADLNVVGKHLGHRSPSSPRAWGGRSCTASGRRTAQGAETDRSRPRPTQRLRRGRMKDRRSSVSSSGCPIAGGSGCIPRSPTAGAIFRSDRSERERAEQTRRAGASRVLRTLGEASTAIPLPYPGCRWQFTSAARSHVDGHGTDLLQSYGCREVLGQPLPPEFCGGKASFAATFGTTIGELDGDHRGLLHRRPRAPSSHDEPADEGVTVVVPEIINFNHTGGGEEHLHPDQLAKRADGGRSPA